MLQIFGLDQKRNASNTQHYEVSITTARLCEKLRAPWSLFIVSHECWYAGDFGDREKVRYLSVASLVAYIPL